MKAKTKRADAKQHVVSIKPPKFEQAAITIRGTAPYVQHRFSQKARLKMEANQAEGGKAKNRRNREPRKPREDYEAAKYVSRQGWIGIPASAFRNACISACRVAGLAMTKMKLSIFVMADGFDKLDGTPLVRIFGTPKMHTATARNDNGGCDIRYRPMFEEWKAKVRIRWDADQFSAEDIVNLMSRVGLQVGIGEGRADSKNSAGCGWGHFEVVA